MTRLWDLPGLTWWELAKRTCRKSWEGEVFGQSAQLAFYFFFSLFPALLLLLILLAMSAAEGSRGRAALLDSFSQILPQGASALIAKTVEELNARAVLGAGAVGAGAYAVWGALNGTWAMMTGLNKAYEVSEERPWWKVLAVMLGLTISLSVLYVIVLAAIAYGDPAGKIVGRHLGTPAYFEFFWRVVEWLVIVIVLLFSFALIYRVGPNLKDRRWQWSIPGAFVAVALWVGSTLLLRVYQESFSSSRIYGGLNAVIVLMIWLYITGAAIFIGGAANSEIEKAAVAAGDSSVREVKEPRSGGAAKSRKKVP
jgi:membrane protein